VSYYSPTRYDVGLFVGTLGLFFTLSCCLPYAGDRDLGGQGCDA